MRLTYTGRVRHRSLHLFYWQTVSRAPYNLYSVPDGSGREERER